MSVFIEEGAENGKDKSAMLSSKNGFKFKKRKILFLLQKNNRKI